MSSISTDHDIIVSGGGGWGLKQGLLSLDPQTTYTTPGDEDIESFIKSFRGESSADSIVAPGSYVQFFVSPMHTPKSRSILDNSGSLPSTVLGTHEISSTETKESGTPSIELIPGLFGGVSTQGLFISSASSNNKLITKVDAPHSYIWNGSQQWW